MHTTFPAARWLALWFVAALLLPYGGIAANDFDDIDDIAIGWFLIFSNVGPVLALLHAWLIARLDRRLVGPSRSRLWAFPEGAGVALVALCLPVVIHGVLLALAGLVEGHGRWVRHSTLAIPFMGGLLLGAAAMAWARYLRRRRQALPHDQGTVGDIVPSAWLWTGWLIGTNGVAGIAAAELASESSVAAGLVVLAVGAAVVVAASLAVARKVASLPAERFERPHALARELAGATAVGLLLPVFLAGIIPSWHNADDVRWALLLGVLIAVPLAVWTQASGRVTRWARWT